MTSITNPTRGRRRATNPNRIEVAVLTPGEIEELVRARVRAELRELVSLWSEPIMVSGLTWDGVDPADHPAFTNGVQYGFNCAANALHRAIDTIGEPR